MHASATGSFAPHARMKAAIACRYGPDAIDIREVEKPLPNPGEVSLRVCAASLNPIDWHMTRGTPWIARLMTGVRRPSMTRPGFDVAGRIEAVGANVTQFKPGDEVFGSSRGAFAEYVCTLETNLVLKPNNISFEQAASVPLAAYTALQALRDKGHIQPGHKVLINGAAGGVGTFAVQLAKIFGGEVTGVCSTPNLDMVRCLGADHVIDYTREDFTRTGQRYDLIFDLVANHSLSACRRALSRNGIYIGAGILGLPMSALPFRLLAAPLLSRFVSQQFIFLMARPRKQDLVVMHDLMKAGKVTPVVDRCYDLHDIRAAVRYLATEHARGKIVIAVQ